MKKSTESAAYFISSKAHYLCGQNHDVSHRVCSSSGLLLALLLAICTEMAFSRIDNLHVALDSNLHISCNVWVPQKIENEQDFSPEQRMEQFRSKTRYDLVFEYVPYRKDDLVFQRDHSRHAYFAQQGFVSIRADMRGTGDSNGTPDASKDASDAAFLLEYFKRLPWASGKVFLFGLSWGGSLALEVAAKYPDLVHGCVVNCSNGDRETAINFTQGCVIASELVPFSNMMLGRCALPMKRNFSWEAWLERLNSTQPDILYGRLGLQVEAPMRPHFDTSNAKAAKCPVLMLTGFRDYARNGVFDLADHDGLNAGSKVILGPWAHNFPDVALPGLDFNLMDAAVLWFKQDQRVTSLPRLSVYCENIAKWHSPTEHGVEDICLHMSETPVVLKEPHALQAVWGGSWFTKGVYDDPGDQSVSNKYSDIWKVPFSHRTIICGVPKVSIEFVDPPTRFYIAATLCVEEGANKTKQISAGMKYVVNTKSIVFELGALCHQKSELPLILTLKSSYFPIIPTMQVDRKIVVSKVNLMLPYITQHIPVSPYFGYPSPTLPKVGIEIIRKPEFSRDIKIGLGGSLPDTLEVTRVTSLGNVSFPDHVFEYDEYGTDIASVPFDLTAPSKYTATRTYTVKHDGNICRTVATTEMVPEESHFAVKVELKAYLVEELVYEKSWERKFNRNS